jgi:hypothetical protein
LAETLAKQQNLEEKNKDIADQAMSKKSQYEWSIRFVPLMVPARFVWGV